jgi:hypothetical protein
MDDNDKKEGVITTAQDALVGTAKAGRGVHFNVGAAHPFGAV